MLALSFRITQLEQHVRDLQLGVNLMRSTIRNVIVDLEDGGDPEEAVVDLKQLIGDPT